MDSYETLQTKYKLLLREAYKVSKTDKDASRQIYAEADRLRQQIFAV